MNVKDKEKDIIRELNNDIQIFVKNFRLMHDSVTVRKKQNEARHVIQNLINEKYDNL